MLCDEGTSNWIQITKNAFLTLIMWISELKYCEENPKTCMNGGKCTSLPEDDGSYKCECPTGFKGKRCEIVPIIANATVASSTPKPSKPSGLATSTKLPSQETTTARQVDDSDDDDVDDDDENIESSTSVSKVVAAPIVEDEISTNEA